MSSFSIGQNFFKDLLQYSDKHVKENEQISTTVALQARAASYFKNNTYPTLRKSQQYSGMVDNEGKNPLGGKIDYKLSGTNNIPSIGICSDEFDFWGKNTVPKPKLHKNVNFTHDIKENFGNNLVNIKENFGNETDMWWIILIIVLVILFIGGGLYLLNK